MINLSKMREKEVINIRDGVKIGYIYDFKMDLDKGTILSIIVPGHSKILGIFGKSNDLMIDWENIVRIGHDTILVDIDEDSEPFKKLDNHK